MKDFKRKFRNFWLLVKFVFTGRKPITIEEDRLRKNRTKKFLQNKAIRNKYKLGKSYKKAPSVEHINDKRIEKFFNLSKN